MLRPLFFSPPDAESEILNAGAPATEETAFPRPKSLPDVVGFVNPHIPENSGFSPWQTGKGPASGEDLGQAAASRR